MAETEYFGIIKLGFVANKIIKLLGTYTVYMEAKQGEVEEVYSITLPTSITAGEYEMVAYTPWGTTSQKHLAERVPVVVNAYDTSTWSDITLTEDYGISFNSIEEYDPITINATFTATGDAPIYDEIGRAHV